MNQRERVYMNRLYRLSDRLRNSTPGNPADVRMWVLKGKRTAQVMNDVSFVLAELMYGDYDPDLIAESLDAAEQSWNDAEATSGTARID